MLKLQIQIELLVDGAKDSQSSFYIHENILKEAEAHFSEMKVAQGDLIQSICGNSLGDKSLKLLSYFNTINMKTLEEISCVRGLLDISASNKPSVLDGKPIKFNSVIKPPELKLGTFEDNSKSPFAYMHFKSSFSGVMDSSGLEDSARLLYLKNCSVGKSLSCIDSLSCCAENYRAAWKLLDGMFLNEEALINDLLQQIVLWPEARTLSEVNEMINKLRTYMFELKKLGLDYLENNSPGLHLLSSVISLKLPKFYSMELCRKTNKAVVAIDSLFEFQTIVSGILEGCNRSKFGPRDDKNKASDRFNSITVNRSDSVPPRNASRGSDESKKGSCKFCLSTLHSSLHCRKYDSYDKRQSRAKALGMCCSCLSKSHKEDSCPGKFNKLPWLCTNCKKQQHVTPLCPTLILPLFQNSSSHSGARS